MNYQPELYLEKLLLESWAPLSKVHIWQVQPARSIANSACTRHTSATISTHNKTEKTNLDCREGGGVALRMYRFLGAAHFAIWFKHSKNLRYLELLVFDSFTVSFSPYSNVYTRSTLFPYQTYFAFATGLKVQHIPSRFLPASPSALFQCALSVPAWLLNFLIAQSLFPLVLAWLLPVLGPLLVKEQVRQSHGLGMLEADAAVARG